MGAIPTDLPDLLHNLLHFTKRAFWRDARPLTHPFTLESLLLSKPLRSCSLCLRGMAFEALVRSGEEAPGTIPEGL